MVKAVATEKEVVDRARAIVALHDRLSENAALSEAALRDAQAKLDATKRLQADIERIIAEKTVCFPWLADAIAKYYELCDLSVADRIERKVRPAAKTADYMRQIASANRKLRREYNLARNRVIYYESLFPHLTEYVGEGLDDLVKSASVDEVSNSSERDPVLDWVPEGEYKKLDEAKRNQLALERYVSRGKSSWEVGREYERFIGYQYEMNGYRVEYHGAIEQLGDLGRDLIARKADETLIIQCKYWRAERQIREKHVFQLYGTSVEYWLRNGGHRRADEYTLFPQSSKVGVIVPVMVTSAELSGEAMTFARALGVQVKERVQIGEYPVIKCNISKGTGEKIYHLPFDQMYDKCEICYADGEMYASTVEDAMKAGFRRAWRWRGALGGAGG
jgi:hypothetical protein